MSTPAAKPVSAPINLSYHVDLLGNIQQALSGLQGFDVMAFELIQNADDARAERLVFDVRDDALVVHNNARFTSCGLQEYRCSWETTGGPDGATRPCNFHALSRIASRSKLYAAEQIGRFGIGFLSVYQITDTPIVRSAGIEMRLEPLSASAPTRPIEDAGGTEFELPFASTSTPTRQALNASATPTDVASLLVEAIAEVMERGLFFLRHLRHVELRRGAGVERSVAIRRESGLLTIESEPDGRVERWKILSRDATDLAEDRQIFTNYPTLATLGRSPVVQVAVPAFDKSVEGLLYAYLPTEQSSNMPLHVNGDFFPHSNRRAIVLTGEQHERHWNQLLLDTAARAMGESFEELRDLLGGARLWALGEALFAARDKKGFSEFWKKFCEAAKAIASVRTVGEQWHEPADCHIPPERMATAEQLALAGIGVRLLHPDLRPHWTALQAAGVSQLKLPVVVAALETRGKPPGISSDDPHLRPLWSAVDIMVEDFRGRLEFVAAMKRLKAAAFLVDMDGQPVSIDEVWRAPAGVSAEAIRTFVEGCPLVHSDVARHAALYDAIDVYGFDNLAGHLAEIIPDASTAEAVIGTEPERVRRFYDLLTSFEVDPDTSQAGSILADVPILRTGDGFISPSRGLLPGGFVDPIGHFELVDTELAGQRMSRFAQDVLDVQVLTLRGYIEDHLEEILAEQPSREQYAALLRQIVEHRAELDGDGGLELLAERAFVRTRSGSHARPDDCYYWSAELEALLGEEGSLWVDEAWMPEARDGARLRDLLEDRLGMRSTVAARHIVDRIAEIAETAATVDIMATRTAPIVRHVLERYQRLRSDELEELERLRSIAFLPGALGGERVQHARFTPGDVYRASRAAGFYSQVHVVDLPPLRGGAGGGALTEFLNLLEMPSEPETELVVAHLEHCMAEGRPAHDFTYAILYERLDEPDADCIDRLKDTDFIYDGRLERYLPAGKVFWERPPFAGRWHGASPRMRQFEALYRRLGVADAPDAASYAALLSEIASFATPSPADSDVHARCLAWLAEALDREEVGAAEAVDSLHGAYALLNVVGEPVWTGSAAWVDSEWLAAPFGDALDQWLVTPPRANREAAARLFRRMGVAPLSEKVRLRLASTPDRHSAPEATALLRERAALLLRLAPTQEFRRALSSILSDIEIGLSGNLHIRAEFIESDPPVPSPPSSVPTFYDTETGILHVRATASEPVDWSAAFQALFAQLESHAHSMDMRPVVGTAVLVMSLPSSSAAEQALERLGYQPLEETGGELSLGEEIGDAPREDAMNGEAFDDREYGDVDPDGTAPDRGGFAAIDPDDDDRDDRTEEHTEAEFGGSDHSSTGAGDTTSRRAAAAGPAVADRPAGQVEDDEVYKSKAAAGAFGAGPGEGTGDRSPDHAGDADAGRQATAADRRNPPAASPGQGETGTERQARRSRLLTYVSGGDPAVSERATGDELSDLIDAEAIKAVLKYERSRGWLPEEQDHANPGYDIISRNADGSARRIIEVKGLEREWTERGVKLSHVQYGMAEAHPDEFWLYVVEHARDLQHQRVSAIANPFFKVREYWFDDGWRQLREEHANADDINLRAGARVNHDIWGSGMIVAVEKRGLARFLLIDFGPIEGRRYVPSTSGLRFVD